MLVPIGGLSSIQEPYVTGIVMEKCAKERIDTSPVRVRLLQSIGTLREY